jgi:putative SOS response-associated peptidase YedK
VCNAYNLRHRNEAILDVALAVQLAVADLPEFPPQYRIGIRQRGLILRPEGKCRLTWSWARWSLVPPGAREIPPYPFHNARADKLGAWPWKAVQRQRCLIPASGFWEPEKPAREKGVAPWSYCAMQDGRTFFMAGLSAEATDAATGEVADTYTLIITDANAIMRVHDRMPVILATDAARRWLDPARCRMSCCQIPGRAVDGMSRERRSQEQPDRATREHG